MQKCAEKPYNAGIGLLKIIMSFEVVLCHFWDVKEKGLLLWQYPFKLMLTWAVPCFIIISFYYGATLFRSREPEKYLKRLYRLILPHIAWTIIYFVTLECIGRLWHKVYIENKTDFFWQLFLGHSASINSTMWFQIDLIIMTVIFWMLYALFNRSFPIVIVVISAICMIAEYVGWNYSIFIQFRREISFPLGRICECLPFACCGLYLSFFRVFDKYGKHKVIHTIICVSMLFILILMKKRNILIIPEGFGYSGIYLVLVSLIMILLFYNLFPYNKYTVQRNNCSSISGMLQSFCYKIRLYLKRISRYTMGVYFSHRIVGILLNESLEKIGGGYKISSFTRCIIIYLLSFILSVLISKIPIKKCKEIVM